MQAAQEGPAGEGGDLQWAHAPCFLPIFGSDQAAPSQTKAILSQIHKPTSPTLQD